MRIASAFSLSGLVIFTIGLALAIAGAVLFPQGDVLADAGGFPTSTPTVTSTWTPPPPPTFTATPGVIFLSPTQKPPEATLIYATPKALPTGTILSDADLVATLQGPTSGQGSGGGRLPFWMYAMMVFLAMALTGLIIFAVMRWLRQSP